MQTQHTVVWSVCVYVCVCVLSHAWHFVSKQSPEQSGTFQPLLLIKHISNHNNFLFLFPSFLSVQDHSAQALIKEQTHTHIHNRHLNTHNNCIPTIPVKTHTLTS